MDRFAQAFRAEHRQIRDALLETISAFEDGDVDRARGLLGRVAALTGPHFRYEEEALYPALVPLFGESYVESLLGDHDRAIGAARELVALVTSPSLGDERRRGADLARGLLPHVSDCEGLSIMTEVLPGETVEEILGARDRSWAADLDLLRWADEVRTRPAVAA